MGNFPNSLFFFRKKIKESPKNVSWTYCFLKSPYFCFLPHCRRHHLTQKIHCKVTDFWSNSYHFCMNRCRNCMETCWVEPMTHFGFLGNCSIVKVINYTKLIIKFKKKTHLKMHKIHNTSPSVYDIPLLNLSSFDSMIK